MTGPVWTALLGGELRPGGSLVWTAPGWVVALAAAAAVVAVVLAVPRDRGDSGVGRTVAALSLWAAALGGLVLAIAGPVWLEEEGRREPGRLAVLVDASRSMGVLEDGSPRSDGVQPVLDALAGPDVDVYHFGSTLQVGPPLAYTLPATDLESALDALGERTAGETLAGVVVVSDGLDRGVLRKGYLLDERPVLPPLPGPLTVYQVGQADALQDLAVRWVDGGGYAYVHAPFTLRARLQGVGFEGRQVPVELLRDGAVVRSERVTVSPDGTAEVGFEVTPDRAGRFTYTVSVPVYDGDAVPSNNVLPVVVRVVRDRLRVLQVAGAPSWDVKFLRRFLKGDPSVDLVSFFILRAPEDLRRQYKESELSLISFPYEQLFTEDLETFDLVVLQNFDHRPYFAGQSVKLLDNLRRFVVEQGHGLIMVGGDRSFSLGEYGGTTLGDILPVAISPQPVDPSLPAFSPRLTTAGSRHPVTRLVADEDENGRWWERLHALDGSNRGFQLAPGASALLEHPSVTGLDGSALPVLAVREVGEGRTMSLSVDTSWRWSLSEAAEGRGNQAYLRFWKGAMRWLVGDPTTQRVTVDTPRENYAVGDEVRAVVQARTPGFGPMPGVEVTLEVRRGPDQETLTTQTGPEGEAVFRLTATDPGAHRLVATVTEGTRTVGTSETVFGVTTRDPELDEVVPDGAFLGWLAAQSGGRRYGPGELGPPLRDASAGRTVFDRHELALWRAPLLLGLVAMCAGLAWILRRRSGLR